MSIPGYLTPAEIRQQFGWGRAQMNSTARREGWTRHNKVGNAYVYPEAEVAEFALIRNRTDLLREAGWSLPPGLVRHDEYDFDPGCPVCEGLAVFGPEMDTWLCVNGHSGEIDSTSR